MAHKIKILNVDDDNMWLEIFQIFMEQYDISVESAMSISEAKEKFDLEKFDGMITDWRLPDGHGIDIADYVRTKSVDFPIIFLSGSTTEFIKDRVQHVHPLDIMLKNCSHEQYAKINSLFRNQETPE